MPYSKLYRYPTLTLYCACSKMLNRGLNHGLFFPFSSLYRSPYIELHMCYSISISCLNFKAVSALPKTACSAETNKSISFIWIVCSILYVCLWPNSKLQLNFGDWMVICWETRQIFGNQMTHGDLNLKIWYILKTFQMIKFWPSQMKILSKKKLWCKMMLDKFGKRVKLTKKVTLHY